PLVRGGRSRRRYRRSRQVRSLFSIPSGWWSTAPRCSRRRRRPRGGRSGQGRSRSAEPFQERLEQRIVEVHELVVGAGGVRRIPANHLRVGLAGRGLEAGGQRMPQLLLRRGHDWAVTEQTGPVYRASGANRAAAWVVFFVSCACAGWV